MELLKQLGAEVRRRRQDRALTLRELAAEAGVSQRFLVSVEKGEANISVVRLADVARALGTDPATLLGGPVQEAVAPGPLVALLGLRGAGKTTIGRRAAERLEQPFTELDAEIVRRAGIELEAIFSMHGADYYRRLEHGALEEILGTGRGGLLATGGGIVTSHATFELLRNQAVTIWLRASAEDHWERVVAQGDARPMANRSDAMSELRSILRARRALYERAHHLVDTSSLGLERSVDAVVRLVRDAVRAS